MTKGIDWYYHRKGCKTCAKSNAYLVNNGLVVLEEEEAKAKPAEEKKEAPKKE